MRVNNKVTKMMTQKEGLLVDSNLKAEVRREYSISSAVNWNLANQLIKEAAEELIESPTYAAQQALKQGGNLAIEFDEAVVNVEFVDGGNLPEFFITSVERLDEAVAI